MLRSNALEISDAPKKMLGRLVLLRWHDALRGSLAGLVCQASFARPSYAREHYHGAHHHPASAVRRLGADVYITHCWLPTASWTGVYLRGRISCSKFAAFPLGHTRARTKPSPFPAVELLECSALPQATLATDSVFGLGKIFRARSQRHDRSDKFR